jgi:5'-phosphate synthase pdxT subunit
MGRVGVLALQGAFVEHIQMLRRLGVNALPVRLPQELEGLDGLVIPGGESTTMAKLMQSYNLTEAIRGLALNGLPVFGSCAGMILLAKSVTQMDLETIGAINIEVRRNAFGRQIDSFETDLSMPVLGEEPFHAIFIRAPIITRVGPEVENLAQLEDGTNVAVRQGKILVCAFHPELTDDIRFHKYFLEVVVG